MNTLNIFSDEISKAVRYSVAHGNEIAEISEGWEKSKQVIHMRKPLTEPVRIKICSLRLRYWTMDGTPHNKAEEGFTDDIEQVAITFPQQSPYRV